MIPCICHNIKTDQFKKRLADEDAYVTPKRMKEIRDEMGQEGYTGCCKCFNAQAENTLGHLVAEHNKNYAPPVKKKISVVPR